MKFPRLRRQDSYPDDYLNEPFEGAVEVATELDHHGDAEESVFSQPEAADHWDARLWKPNP